MDNVYQMIHQSINARLFDVVVDIFVKMEFVLKILAQSQHVHWTLFIKQLCVKIQGQTTKLALSSIISVLLTLYSVESKRMEPELTSQGTAKLAKTPV